MFTLALRLQTFLIVTQRSTKPMNYFAFLCSNASFSVLSYFTIFAVFTSKLSTKSFPLFFHTIDFTACQKYGKIKKSDIIKML